MFQEVDFVYSSVYKYMAIFQYLGRMAGTINVTLTVVWLHDICSNGVPDPPFCVSTYESVSLTGGIHALSRKGKICTLTSPAAIASMANGVAFAFQ